MGHPLVIYTGSARERTDVLEGEDRARFEVTVLPHLDAAFNLARWLLRSRSDAEDVAQEALLRAYRAFGTYRSGNPLRRAIVDLAGARSAVQVSRNSRAPRARRLLL